MVSCDSSVGKADTGPCSLQVGKWSATTDQATRSLQTRIGEKGRKRSKRRRKRKGIEIEIESPEKELKWIID
jgi:hypothetical protein